MKYMLEAKPALRAATMAMDSITLERGLMKSHMLLLRVVLIEMGTRCCTSTTLDQNTIESRVEHEGLSYLTIALPQFGKDFERGLDQGAVDPTLFVGYAKKECLPKFLSGFTGQVFDVKSGKLLDNPSIDAIQAIRQITLLFGKVKLPCSDTRVRAAFDKYVECEQQVRISDASLSEVLRDQFIDMSLILFGDLFARMDKDVYDGNIIPKHGPGATADRITGNQKYEQTVWTERLERIFPHGEFLFSSWRQFVDAPEVHLLDPGAEIPVRVITVPKTLKTPRIIAIEPTCMQYAQQGILRSFMKHLSRDDILVHMLGIRDQIPNQELARVGSVEGHLATLDLSEASDRVSNQHVRYLLKYFPHLSEAVDASRSRKADVPGHGVLRLAKFASMGSALCFPMEAAVFLTVIFLGIQQDLNFPLTPRKIKSFVGKVRVYGDDIVIPVEHVDSVVAMLETFGFRVNSGKSFWTGKFRESCGKEYYDGHDVTVVRFRQMLPTHRTHVTQVVSATSLRNQFYFAGCWEVAGWLDKWMKRVIPFPTIEPTSPALGRHSFLGHEVQKECPNLQRPLVRAFSVRNRLPSDQLDGAGALLKFFIGKGDGILTDILYPDRYEDPIDVSHLYPEGTPDDHLERAGRPSVDIKLGWTSAI